jgi:glycosyltransferase involved in cell wall biosynthesis
MMASIVIPCYNHARFLAEAIESALAQTWPSIEVVVIDDGSTDDTAAVAARYRGVRLVSQANQGLAFARNVGLRVSRGDVLIFLDADDRLRPCAAAAAVAAFERCPAAMMAFGRCELMHEDGAPMPTNLPCVTADFYAELLRRNYIWMPAMSAFRRRVFDLVGGFDPRHSPSADYDLYLRVAQRFEMVAHGEVVADYRQHPASMSRNPSVMLEATLAVLRAQQPHVRRVPALAAAYRAGWRHWHVFYGEHLVDRFRTSIRGGGGRRTSLRLAADLLRWYPSGVIVQLARKLRRVAADLVAMF